MTIGVLKLILFIPNSNSLKEKRMVLHSLKARIRNNFNLAVTQIGDDDKWQVATLAIAGVERQRSQMNSTLSAVINFIENFKNLELLNQEMELL
jgi:uncharacterized protein YlxP (DUF503 family)